jgi:hypothetical protein
LNSYSTKDGKEFYPIIHPVGKKPKYDAIKLIQIFKPQRLFGDCFEDVINKFKRRGQLLDLLYSLTIIPKELLLVIVDEYSDYIIQETIMHAQRASGN